jgi:hypothetical protein
MTTKEKSSICDRSTASLPGKDSPTPYDLDRVLAEAAEEMQFDLPELLPSERIKTRIMEIALGLLLFAALVAFCCFG